MEPHNEHSVTTATRLNRLIHLKSPGWLCFFTGLFWWLPYQAWVWRGCYGDPRLNCIGLAWAMLQARAFRRPVLPEKNAAAAGLNETVTRK